MEMEIVSPDNQFMLFLDDVRLPADALVGEEDAALMQLFAGLNPERIIGAAMAVGMGRYALDARGRLRERTHGVEHADRRAPGHRASAGADQDRDSNWPS